MSSSPPQREAAAALLTKLELFKMREALGLDHEELPPAAEAEAKAPAQWTLVLHADAGEIAARCKAQGACYVTGQFSGRQLLWLSVADGERAYLFEDPDDCRTVLRSGAPLFTFDAKPLFGFLGEAERTAPAAACVRRAARGLSFKSIGQKLCIRAPVRGGTACRCAKTSPARGCLPPTSRAHRTCCRARTLARCRNFAKSFRKKSKGAGERPLLCATSSSRSHAFWPTWRRSALPSTATQLPNTARNSSGRKTPCARDVFEKAGYTFNVNSPKQLGEALFGKLGLPAREKDEKTAGRRALPYSRSCATTTRLSSRCCCNTAPSQS